MDEQKLAELFRDAARDAPPPSFDVAAVRSASARASARRRSAIAVGSAMALVLVFGGVVATANLTGNTNGDAAAGSAQEAASPNVTPFSADEPEVLSQDAPSDRSGGTPPKSIPEDPSTQGDEPSGSADRPSVGSAQRGCVEVDRELAVALADELSVANDASASPAAANCPDNTRGASFLVRDGGVYGVVSAVIAPAGTTAPAPDPDYAYASAKTSRGEELYLISQSDEGSAPVPFERELPAMAQRLAAKL